MDKKLTDIRAAGLDGAVSARAIEPIKPPIARKCPRLSRNTGIAATKCAASAASRVFSVPPGASASSRAGHASRSLPVATAFLAASSAGFEGMFASIGGVAIAARARPTARARPPAPRAVGNSSSSATTTSVRDAIPARARATRVALSAAAALVLALAPRNDAFAFVPVTGCGDPGSPYDTGVRREDGAAVANCQKLYQPARAAESRAVVAAAAAAAERANTAPGPATTEP